MKKISLLLIASVLLIACDQEKTAFIDNEILSKNYKALEELNTRFDKKADKLQELWNTDIQAFQKKVEEFQQKANSMSTAQLEKRQNELLDEQDQMRQDQQLHQSLLMQQKNNAFDSLEDIVKVKIKEYAKANKYTYIFGANEDNNIFYGDESRDITKDILKELNASSN